MSFMHHPLWLVGFRPFFLLGCLAGALLPLAWALIFSGVGALTASPVDALRWHAHEMFFGFGWAVLGGFLLTLATSCGLATLHFVALLPETAEGGTLLKVEVCRQLGDFKAAGHWLDWPVTTALEPLRDFQRDLIARGDTTCEFLAAENKHVLQSTGTGPVYTAGKKFHEWVVSPLNKDK
jgi:hypothetical protein